MVSAYRETYGRGAFESVEWKLHMRIVSKAIDRGYEVYCENCGSEFDSGPVGLAFECPACGRSALAAEIVSEWMLRTMAVAAAE